MEVTYQISEKRKRKEVRKSKKDYLLYLRVRLLLDKGLLPSEP